MNDSKPADPVSPRDQLITRPDEPLATPLDPASPEARGYPYDPKPGKGNEDSAGNPANTETQRKVDAVA